MEPYRHPRQSPSFLGRRFVRGVILPLVGIGAAYFVLMTGLEMLFAPWARSLGLWSTLTGEWHGQLQMPDGRVMPVYFDIDDRIRQRDIMFEGTAKWCEARDRIRVYRISGDADNWRGTQFHFSPVADDRDQGDISVGELRGERQENEIRAISYLIPRGPVTASATATRSSRSEDPPPPGVRYQLRRGSERDFEAACAGASPPSR